jgi:pyocin large subunit-like protein
MDIDTTINGLAHELWAIAQGVAPIEDVVTPIMLELQQFADAVMAAERDRWIAKAGSAYTEAHAIFNDPPSETAQEVRELIE